METHPGRDMKDQKKREILFGDFVFHDGLNVTIRCGFKWYGAKGIYAALPSDWAEGKAVPERRIEIIKTEIYRFSELPAKVLSMEHIESCRSYDNLLEAMRKAYDDFDEEKYVTVIYFEVLK